MASFAISESAVSDVTPRASREASSGAARAQVYSSVGFISDSAYSETAVGNAKAAWYETGALVWENAGISYALGVPGM
jgi:hypothetical protein